MSRPNLVLTDLNMPGMDGVEIVRWLKQLQNPSVVFVITSDDHPVSRARILAAGADAFLLKTEDLGLRLHAAIQNFLVNKQNRNDRQRSTL